MSDFASSQCYEKGVKILQRNGRGSLCTASNSSKSFYVASMFLEPPNDPGTGGVAHEAISPAAIGQMTTGAQGAEDARTRAGGEKAQTRSQVSLKSIKNMNIFKRHILASYICHRAQAKT